MNHNELPYISSNELTLIISKELELVRSRFLKVVETERKELLESQISHDNTCPMCRASKDMVINSDHKNHCNSCGHEWDKFKTKNITSINVTKTVFNYLSDIIIEPEKCIDCDWKFDTIQIFNGCHAESLYRLQQDTILSSKFPLRHPLTLSQLKTKYDSVLDYSN